MSGSRQKRPMSRLFGTPTRGEPLSINEQEIIRLATAAGYTDRQISRMLGRSIWTVRHRRLVAMRICKIALIVLAFLPFGATAQHPGVDDATSAWFGSLSVPGTGVSCCSPSHDCHQVDEYRGGKGDA